MTKRERRVIEAFISCVRHGEFTADYACLLIEDTARYGYLTDDAKESFYSAIEPEEPTEGDSEDTEESGAAEATEEE